MDALLLDLLSPYVTLILSGLVLYRWTFRLVYNFQWNLIGAVAARLIFTVIYGIIVLYHPPAESLRLVVRISINLLFLDELINWGVTSSTRGVNLIWYTKKFIREFKLH